MQQPRAPTVDDVLLNSIRRQIEFYFSKHNLQRDEFFQQLLFTHRGYVPVSILAHYPMIQQIYQKSGYNNESIESIIIRALEHSRLVSYTADHYYVYVVRSSSPTTMNHQFDQAYYQHYPMASPDPSEMARFAANEKVKDTATQATATSTCSASGSPTSFMTMESMMSHDGTMSPAFCHPMYPGYASPTPFFVGPSSSPSVARPIPRQAPAAVMYHQQFIPPTAVPPNTPCKQFMAPAPHEHTAPVPTPAHGFVHHPQQFSHQPSGFVWSQNKPVQQPTYQAPTGTYFQAPMQGHYFVETASNPMMPTNPTPMMYPNHGVPVMQQHPDTSTVGSAGGGYPEHVFVSDRQFSPQTNSYLSGDRSPTKPRNNFKHNKNNKGFRNKRKGNTNNNTKRGNGQQDRGNSPVLKDQEVHENNNQEVQKPRAPKNYLEAVLHSQQSGEQGQQQSSHKAAEHGTAAGAGKKSLEEQMKKLSVSG